MKDEVFPQGEVSFIDLFLVRWNFFYDSKICKRKRGEKDVTNVNDIPNHTRLHCKGLL